MATGIGWGGEDEQNLGGNGVWREREERRKNGRKYKGRREIKERAKEGKKGGRGEEMDDGEENLLLLLIKKE